MNKLLKASIFLGLIMFTIHTINIVNDGLTDTYSKDAKIAIILGSKVNEDGSLSKRLKARVDKGLSLYHQSLVNQIYVSGGLGKEGHLEGSVMAQYLIEHGVAQNDIIIDNKGVNTRSTAVNFANDFPNVKSAYVVSQYFHISRCKLALNQVGVDYVYGAHCPYFEVRDPYSIFREFFGYYKYLLFY